MKIQNFLFILILTIVLTIIGLVLVFYLVRTTGSDLTIILKYSLAYILIMTAIFFWIITLMYEHISIIVNNLAGSQYNSERILLDLRDDTKHFYNEKRRAFRVKADLTAQLVTKNVCDFIKTIDLSYDGALLKTTREFQIGDVIGFNLYLPLYPKPVNIRVKVIRILHEKHEGKTVLYNVGVKYLEMPPADKEKLIETLDAINKKSSAKK